ncbi:hypothetical protein H5410_003445 [Solanum commersonii]|uniref:Uncharacterized protein n=1 Tax=Solanum commersonii TaxID=4109 RepID=A0A9J6B524_SOLCO|nr:hypothetical protein H5410_003445 [Solanum commersonii]
MGSSRTPTCRMKNNLRLISKQAKNEESTRPKSKFLELKPFESSSSSKPSPNLELKSLGSFSIVSRDHRSTRRSSFSRFHRGLALSFSIAMFGLLGDIGSGPLEHWVRIRSFGNSPNGFGDSQILISSFFQLPLFLFCQVVSMFSLKLQIPEI